MRPLFRHLLMEIVSQSRDLRNADKLLKDALDKEMNAKALKDAINKANTALKNDNSLQQTKNLLAREEPVFDAKIVRAVATRVVDSPESHSKSKGDADQGTI
jgi:hypothetical protein